VIGPTGLAHVLVYQLWCEQFWWYAVVGEPVSEGSEERKPVTIERAVERAKIDAMILHAQRYPELVPGFYTQTALETVKCIDIFGIESCKQEYLSPVRYGRYSQ
jgi:hypothetical protein